MTGVAVVIPCNDLGRFVEEAVASVLRQSRAAAEIVVVDDGSADLNTRQVLATLARDRVRVVRTENRGAAAARNHGIRLTSAPLLVTLDADDVLERDYLEDTARRLETDPSLGFVSTAYQAFGDESYVWTPPSCDLVTAFAQGSAHVASMFRRELWQAVGGFDETLRTAEDLEFWIAAMARGFRGDVLPDALLRVRVRRSSKHRTHAANGGYAEARRAILSKHRATVEALGPELLLAKEAFLVSQRAHQRRLEAERLELEQELGRLHGEVAASTAELRRQRAQAVDWGDLRRADPISPMWGLDRGRPVDRYYIEAFLDAHQGDIQGRVLEVKDSHYTERFGGERVRERHVIDIDPGNPHATVVADLTAANHVPSDRFDCFILTQTLHIIYDVRAAVRHAHRILAPGGVLLCTLPAVSRVNYEDGGLDGGDHWRFTEASTRKLFAEFFRLDAYQVTVFGNLMACTAFLYGLSPDELDRSELDAVDPWFPLGFCVRAVKAVDDPHHD